MAYRHGVYISEVPTSIIPPVRTTAGLPFVVGTAPINLTDKTNVNKPVLCYSYQEAVEAFGYSDDWLNYTLCEFMYSHFALFNVAPVVLVNVLDPTVHKGSATAEAHTFAADNPAVTLFKQGVLLDSVIVKSEDGTTTYELNTDYTVGFDEDGNAVITRLEGGAIGEVSPIEVGYDYIDPSMVTADDIIGGVDIVTGNYEGLELLDKVFPMFGLVPGIVLAPGWSHDPEVAAVMTAKASNINAHFKCIALTDIPVDEVTKYTEASEWKNHNNYVSPRQVVCWPKVKLGDNEFHLSTQLAGIMCKTDAENDDVPYVSPSNKNLQANSAVAGDNEVMLGPEQGAYLNGQGVVTALNFVGGWKAWGNRTGAYPSITDVKDTFIPIRRMFDWIGNTLVLTFWQKVDYPITKRLVDTIIDSANIWLNGLAAREFILGGRVEFLRDENPTTDLIDGIIRFHVYVTPPAPAREIDFIVEYDPQYLETLFAA
jgi:phage tail sheath protein FI